MAGLKNNISKDGRLWIDQYPDGSIRIINDGNNWKTDRVEINMTKTEFMALVGTYMLEDANWNEEMGSKVVE